MTSAAGGAATVSLQKLTVAQLKAICKEQKIAGYSKLGKAALIEKLVAARGKEETAPKDATSSVKNVRLAVDVTRAESVRIGAKASPAPPKRQPGDTNDTHIAQAEVPPSVSGRTRDGVLSYFELHVLPCSLYATSFRNVPESLYYP